MAENESQAAVLSEVGENPEIIQCAYPNLKSLVSLFFALTLISLFTLIFWSLLFGNLKKWDGPLLIKSLLHIFFAAIVYILWIAYTVQKSKKKQGYFDGISWRKIPLWLIPLIITGSVALCIPEGRISSMIPMPEIFRKAFSEVFSKDLSSVITAIILAPIAEEILFRGIILRGLLKNYSPLKAILISALFFAFIHLNPWQAAPAFLGDYFWDGFILKRNLLFQV